MCRCLLISATLVKQLLQTKPVLNCLIFHFNRPPRYMGEGFVVLQTADCKVTYFQDEPGSLMTLFLVMRYSGWWVVQLGF